LRAAENGLWMKKGHVPIRTCVGCGRKRPAVEMVRIKASNDTIVVAHGKDSLPGRGCYLCPAAKCVEAALKKGRIARALRREVIDIPSKEELLRRLEQKG
jgi:uncharacterized protein